MGFAFLSLMKESAIQYDIINKMEQKHPKKFYAGQIHYSRIPIEYWQHRILMIKAMGLNCLSVYVMWNHHEIKPGVFDFKSDNKDLPRFLDLAVKHNMLVLFRPGPYVCAQWDFGGHPAWLLANKTDCDVRTNTPDYINAVKRYFKALAPIVIKYDQKNGGPIFLLQVQNQYGFFADDISYINKLRQMWTELGVHTEQYHADPPHCIQKSHWKGGIIGVNNGNCKQDYELANKLDPDAFVFGGEIYTGWMTHWGEPWAVKTIDHQTNLFGFLLGNNYSFSMYMIHGGTNFGFTAGANGKEEESDYWADVTSYDYDAPINEQGAPNAKYFALRDLFKRHTQYQVSAIPQPIKLIKIEAFTPKPYASLLQNLPQPIVLQTYHHFQSNQLQMYHQGLVVYEFQLDAGNHQYQLKVHDFGILLVNNEVTAVFDRHKSSKHELNLQLKSKSNIKLVVEAMGHINFDKAMNKDRKGLVEFKNLNQKKQPINSWIHYKIPLNYEQFHSYYNIKSNACLQFLKHIFDLQEIGDTYFNMKDYVKGYVWVNGRNLGRFWNRGPQIKLYCPGVWLKNKGNQIIILELSETSNKPITGDLELK